MDKYSKIVNSILIEHTSILKENQLAEISPRGGQSFGEFLRSLTGKSIKDILDSGSYARLFSMNMHGIGGNKNSPDDPAVLLSKFLTKLGDYVNKDITKLRSGAAETDEFKKKYDYEGHLEREKERKHLFHDIMTEKDPEKKSELRQKMNAFRNNSEYAEARRALHKKEDKAVNEFHNKPIEQGQLVNDGSQEFKDLERMFNQIQSMRKGVEIEDQESGIRSLDGFFSDEEAHIEDQEQSFLTKDQREAITLAQDLATKAARSGVPGFRKDPQKEINKAYGDVMKKVAGKIKTIKI